MLPLVDGLGRCRCVAPLFLGFQVRTGVAVLSSMKTGLPRLAIVSTSKYIFWSIDIRLMSEPNRIESNQMKTENKCHCRVISNKRLCVFVCGALYFQPIDLADSNTGGRI